MRRNGDDLIGQINRYGYRTVVLHHTGLARRFSVHRLVCEAFHGPAPEGYQAAHLDGNPMNNSAANLAWKTAKQNTADKISHGTHQAGENHPRARLTAEQVAALRAMQGQGQSQRAMARHFGISQTHVCHILRGERWAS